jgi:hypothetical protein
LITKAVSATRKLLMKAFLIVLLTLSSFCIYAQAKEPKAYYNSLTKQLSYPDTLFIYEVSSTWGNGIDLFIAFKNSQITSGYWLNKNFTQYRLLSRNLLPKDSLLGVEKLIIDSTINASTVLSFISRNHLFNVVNGDSCVMKDNVEDGNNYTLTKITKDSLITTSEYEIYNAHKQCPANNKYKLFVELDSLFQNSFNKSNRLTKELIEEYRNKKGL